VAESTRLVDLVQAGAERFLSDRESEFAEIADELQPFAAFARDLLAGGKRFRALFCYWGWQSVRSLVDPLDPLPTDDRSAEFDAVILACTALEFFHAAALVHDDLMDNSDTRRGLPSVHRRFEALHAKAGWSGRSGQFGRSGGLLLGDLLLGWSDELLDSGLALLADPRVARAARAEFGRMRTEVTVGQYLDILEEAAWSEHSETEQLSRAHRVIVYKSAKYSVESPLALGAALGGATLPQLAALRAFGLPLGIAYQLRDDLLGVFGDPAETGKPAGDDLREGKRTVLVALARTKVTGGARRTLDELLGDPELDIQQIRMLQSTILDSGAVEQIERIIERNVRLAQDAVAEAPLTRAAREQLSRLAERVTQRSS
jgi:geranylgeranyl diphosphate synthase type I